ncbi:MAG: hypothetical protein AB1918_00970 [Pseudomonadota bacterium]
MNRKALATVVIGDRYVSEWERWFRPSWEAYGRKHGYDVIAIGDHIDPGPRGRARTPNWQKLLVLEAEQLAGYDDVVWVDADILINHHSAPCIVTHHDSPLVGVVSDKLALYSSEKRDTVVARSAPLGGKKPRCADYYRDAGLPAGVDDYSNTGVMVLKPHHRAELRRVYDTAEETPFSAKEETPLSHHLHGNALVKPLDPRFNRIWSSAMIENYPWLSHMACRRHPAGPMLVGLAVNAAWHNSWFLHFTDDRLEDGGQSFSLRNDVGFVMQHVSNIMEISVG